jgi:hypothetical protein
MAQRKLKEISTTDVLLDQNTLAERLTGPSGSGPKPRTLERWRTDGCGPEYVKVGHRVLYKQSAVERWLDDQTRTHTHDKRRRSR